MMPNHFRFKERALSSSDFRVFLIPLFSNQQKMPPKKSNPLPTAVEKGIKSFNNQGNLSPVSPKAQTAPKTSVLSATPKVAQILQSTHSHESAATNMDKLSGNMKWRSKKNFTEFLSILQLGIGLTFRATKKTNVSLADLTNLTIKRPIHQRTQITRS